MNPYTTWSPPTRNSQESSKNAQVSDGRRWSKHFHDLIISFPSLYSFVAVAVKIITREKGFAVFWEKVLNNEQRDINNFVAYSCPAVFQFFSGEIFSFSGNDLGFRNRDEKAIRL
ncbi:hypothetical protein AVEN_273268-1 [Araneus ventricosus]|uniref:Uncharacterized protein n=1 Tax=Araneus ventricosus TaxID=182803 RepID=A0A4Y2I311_ARAVE|nr:hypothetical protein AVEN_273268-1 [Araneus ventricosus]